MSELITVLPGQDVIALTIQKTPEEIEQIKRNDVDKYFEFYQAVPSDNIIVTHNLNKYPSATVVDSAGTQLLVEVRHLSKNRAQILPSSKISCTIFFN